MLTRHSLVASVDIGASTTTAVIAEVDSFGYVELLGHGQSPTRGFSDYVVDDIRELSASISASVDAAEEQAGQHSGALIVAVGGEHVRIMQSRGGVPLQQHAGRKGSFISRQDIRKAVANAGAVPLPDDLQVIHVLPVGYQVDGQPVRNAEGLSGTRLDAEVMIVAGRKTILNSIVKAAEYGGGRVRNFCYRPLATGMAVLSREDMDQGACLVDVGGRHTDVAIFREGKMLFTSTIALGGENLTADTCSLLEVSAGEAEKIKLRYGHCQAVLTDDVEFQISGKADGSLWRTVRKSDLGVKAIQPRAEEILEEAFAVICAYTGQAKLPGGVVLTGGASQLPGFSELAAAISPFSVTAGVNSGFEGIADLAGRPDHAAALGLVLLDMEQRLSHREDVLDNPVSRWCGRILSKINTVM